MFAIFQKEMKKNILVIISYVVLTVAMALIFNDYLPGLFDDERDILATNYSIMMGIFVNMIIFGGLMANEKEEDQSNGYEFMRSLPIDSWQIVAGKFLSAFVCGAISIVTVVAVTNILGTKLDTKLIPVAYALFTSGMALVLVGVMYLFAVRIRYSRFLPVIMLTYIAMMMLPQIGNFVCLITEQESTLEQIFLTLTIPVGGIIFLICLVLFVALGYWTVRIKERTPAPK